MICGVCGLETENINTCDNCGGFPTDTQEIHELRMMFNAVKNKENWKLPPRPFNTIKTREAYKMERALIHFLGGCEMKWNQKDGFTITSKGYYHYIKS